MVNYETINTLSSLRQKSKVHQRLPTVHKMKQTDKRGMKNWGCFQSLGSFPYSILSLWNPTQICSWLSCYPYLLLVLNTHTMSISYTICTPLSQYTFTEFVHTSKLCTFPIQFLVIVWKHSSFFFVCFYSVHTLRHSKLCYNLFYFPFSKVRISKFSLVNIPQPRPRVTIAMCNLLNIQVPPTFQKFTLCPVTFMKDLYIVSAFAKRKKSRENFCFYKKGTESEKTAFNICFAALRQCIPWVASANTNLLPQELHSSS